MVDTALITKNKEIAPYTWFQVGGQATYFARPKTQEELSQILATIPHDTPITVLGAGSNVLVRDTGFDGLIIRLTRLNFIHVQDDNTVTVGAGCLNRSLVYTLAEKGLGGLEFMVSIPGSIGGAVAMNAGCYGFETKDKLRSIDLMMRNGEIISLKRSAIEMTYRHTTLPQQAIILSATFALDKKEKADILHQCDAYLKQREENQPTRGKTGGSTFKNPENSPKKAWELLDESGCRGIRVGGAHMSQKHCNFLMNTDHATAHDIEALIKLCQEKVLKRTGITLEAEIKIIGNL